MNVILFDIDGTLIRSGGAGRDAIDVALQTVFGKIGSEAVEVNGRTDRGIVSQLFRHHGLDDTDDNWRRFQAAYLAALPHALAARRGHILAGVAELLTALGGVEHTVLGLLTGNVRAGAQIKLAHYALEGFFACGGFGDAHHDRDDVAREAIRSAQLHLGERGRPERVWVVGDTPLDIRCARAIGARVAAVGTGTFTTGELAPFGPDLLLDNLRDVAGLVRCFTQSA